MAHINRTHRVRVDWLFLLARTDPGICLRYVNTKSQLADIMTKGSFTAQTWSDLCQLNQVGITIMNVKQTSSTGQVPDSKPIGKKATAKAKAKAKGNANLCIEAEPKKTGLWIRMTSRPNVLFMTMN